MRFLPYSKKEPAQEEEITEPKEAAVKPFPPGIKGKLPQLLTLLEGKLTDNWSEINKTFIINDIERFAKIVGELGEEYDLAMLAGWGNRLLEQVKNFDVEKITGILMGFPALIEKIKSTAKQGGGEEDDR
jgi:hypothetical protein